MKKLIYLSILVLIVACGGSDSDDSNTSIVGNWQLTAMLASGTSIHNSCDLESNMTISTANTGKYNQYFFHLDYYTEKLFTIKKYSKINTGIKYKTALKFNKEPSITILKIIQLKHFITSMCAYF